ncbi:MAG: mismatch-specific DNA-glycosylase [Rhizobium sp.]|nr:mismatch-specific DNA-glycosylase [Rhizobium sp.]
MDVLEDLLQPGLRLVFCGTAAGTRSAQIGAYYAGRGNKFWRTIHAIGLTDRLVAPEDWRLLAHHGIGFTDLAKHHSGMDIALPPGCFDPARLRTAIETHRPGTVAFNGKAAAKVFYGRKDVGYGRQPEPIGSTIPWVLPSTSGAASGAWSIEPWRQLAEALADRP